MPGTTGSPKAAMLSHINLINNARLVGERLCLNPNEVVCCPPPLFHCFGFVLGFLGSFTNGSSVVFPAPRFDPDSVLDAIEAERCTVLYGVPTTFVAELDAKAKRRRKLTSLKTGLASGSPVPQALMNRLEQDMGIQKMLIAYGMTETSPVTFATSFGCPPEHRLDSVGTVFPHTAAKIIDLEGNIVHRGVRGEICTSGYALQQGYFDNEEKTNDVMRMDTDGVLWMHTGDEGVIDEDGYCRRQATNSPVSPGGENIILAEIEERLLAHASIVEVSVVGVPDDSYVSCVFACPFDGPTPHQAVLNCSRQLLDMGCYEISLGDTVGVGVPTDVPRLVRYLIDAGIPVERLAGHFHDTYGQAIANVWAANDCGTRVFDSSVAGLEGCPYAPGAKGNLATEDLVYTLHRAGFDTGVDLAKLVDAGVWISQQLCVPNSSRAGSALAVKAVATPQRQSSLP
ncbi:Putative acyl-CoA synthetase YngI [Tolypocladium paradoxum]|uniref:Acyl-CoA synthetase YngI n=1 Tax=Tolypocladium paradoxum TaxID=94208 RepID=A0A2S4L8X6_9HYPO|nr:Putative acyl-CoA synthetase YngI [Tolypocladium paradoxum]